MKSDKFREIFQYEKFDRQVYKMLFTELKLERENVIMKYFLNRSSICSMVCFDKPLNIFFNCYDKCFINLNKRFEVNEFNINESENLLLNLKKNFNNQENNEEIPLIIKKKKISDQLDFPDHMYNSGKQEEENRDNSAESSIFGRNKSSNKDHFKNRMFK